MGVSKQPLLFQNKTFSKSFVKMATGGPKSLMTHAQRVCRAYKQALKVKKDYIITKHEYRYQACLIRAQFDATRDETDEKIFQSRHLQPNFYALDEGGICYSRELSNVDMQLDTLHPWEQAEFPDFFEKREEMKKRYKKYWEESLSKKFEGSAFTGEFPLISPEVAALK